MARIENSDYIIQDGIERLLRETYRDKNQDGPWYKIGSDATAKDLSDEDRKTLLSNSRDRYFKTPEARSVIKALTHYVMGKGIIYHAEDENPAVQEELDKFWTDPLNHMELRQKEMIIRTFRDGETFIRYYKRIDGTTVIRFVEPTEMAKINKNKDDREIVESYTRQWIPVGETTVREETIPASDITHIKLGADFDMDRGRPLLEPIIKRLIELEQFIEGRIRRNRIGSSYILEKIIHGKGATAEAVSSVKDGMTDATKDTGISTAPKKMPKLGSVSVHGENIEYKWTNPEIKADDCTADARLIKLSICAGLNLPEYLLSDASNANYASTFVAESPFVRMCEDLQDTFEEYFKQILQKVIQNLIASGKIPAISTQTVIKEKGKSLLQKLIYNIREAYNGNEKKEVVPTKTTVKIEFPPMQHKDMKQETEAYQIHSMMGWASDRTLAGKLGYNYDQEWQEIEKQKAVNAELNNPDGEYEKKRDEEIDATATEK